MLFKAWLPLQKNKARKGDREESFLQEPVLQKYMSEDAAKAAVHCIKC